MTTRIGIIADDFTGATDAGALLARGGADVRLRTGLPAAPPDGTGEIEIVALKIRTVPVPEAMDAAAAALDWLRAAGAKRIYWKYCSTFDSTPQGNIGPVAEMLMSRLGAAATVYCPAFPENGRTVYKGRLFVGDLPLDESPMKDHPLTPMRDASLLRLLAPQVAGKVANIPLQTVQGGTAPLAEAAARAIAGGAAHLVPDAITDGDLAALGAAFGEWPLLTGGSAFAAAAYAGAALGRPPAPPKAVREGAALILSGSCSAATRAQVAAFAATGAPMIALDPEALSEGAPPPVDAVLAALGPRPVLVTSTAEPEELRRVQGALGAGRASAVIEAATARIAQAARAAGAARIVVAGGETSGAVTTALAAESLTIGPEIAPGVPWCYGKDAQGAYALALKSGNFGGPEFFTEAIGMLEAR